MRKIAVLEKTKTPYRPPLFNHVGQSVDLTVYYVGKTPSHRQWEVGSGADSYQERHLNQYHTGPLTVAPALRKELIEGDYDEIYAASELNMLPNSLLAASASKRINAKLTVWTEYISTPWISGEGRPRNVKYFKKLFRPNVMRIQNRLYSNADRIIAYCDLAEECAVETGADRSKIVVAPPWYPPEALDSPSTDVKKSSKFRVLFVGELTKRKGVDTLIETVKYFDSGDHVEFAIAGDGPLAGLVTETADTNPNVSYLGYIKREQKAAEFHAADVLILPSRHDPWGQVVNEAYIFGTSAITTHTAGSEMIVPEELTIEPGNAKALYDAINWAKDHELDVPPQPGLDRMAAPLINPPQAEPTQQ